MASLRYLTPYVLILAFQYVVAKNALGYTTPAVLETVSSAITLVALLAINRGRTAFNREMVVFCICFWASGVFWLYGLSYISASQSAILSFTMPLFAIPLSVLVLGERGSRLEVSGGVVGFVGIVVFNLPLLNGGVETLGVALALCSAFCWAVFSIFMRRMSSQDSVSTLTTGFLFAVPLWGVLALLDHSFTESPDLGFDIAYIALAGGLLSMYLWSELLKGERVAKLTVLIFVTPVITLVYGIVTTGVLPGILTLAGVALIFAGIYISNILGQTGTETGPQVRETGIDGTSTRNK